MGGTQPPHPNHQSNPNHQSTQNKCFVQYHQNPPRIFVQFYFTKPIDNCKILIYNVITNKEQFNIEEDLNMNEMEKLKACLEDVSKSYLRKIKLARPVSVISRIDFAIFPNFGVIHLEIYKPEWKQYVRIRTVRVDEVRREENDSVVIIIAENLKIVIVEDKIISIKTPSFWGYSEIKKIS